MLSRRQLVAGLAAGAATAGHIGGVRAAAYPFSLGVASGDPAPDGFIIWTRLAPDPFNGGGMPANPVDVTWEVAADEGFRTVVGYGAAPALPQSAHTIHVELGGLEPQRDYFYRFTALGARSPVGRARTLPAAGAAVAAFSFASIGCQRWEHGYYTAFRDVADRALDAIFHYGDYIYEFAHQRADRGVNVREMPLDFAECTTLADYRNRYALYKSDPDLQAAHHSAPFIMSFDDHEVDNDWAGDHSAWGYDIVPAADFLRRRAAAFQAWYEHMPVRAALIPRGSDIAMYRRFDIGALARLCVLDTRQYRSPQPCGAGWAICDEAGDPARTMLGSAQEDWLQRELRASRAPWNVLAQQVIMMQRRRNRPPEAPETHMDKWDTAPAARDRLFRVIDEGKIPGVVSLAGDLHVNIAGDLKRNFADENSPILGVDLVASSATSEGDGADMTPGGQRSLEANPHIKFFNGNRGYLLNTVTPGLWRADFRIVPRVSVPGQPAQTRRTLVVETGSPGLKDA